MCYAAPNYNFYKKIDQKQRIRGKTCDKKSLYWFATEYIIIFNYIYCVKKKIHTTRWIKKKIIGTAFTNHEK